MANRMSEGAVTVYPEVWDAAMLLGSDDFKALFMSMRRYSLTGEEPTAEELGEARILWPMVRNKIDATLVYKARDSINKSYGHYCGSAKKAGEQRLSFDDWCTEHGYKVGDDGKVIVDDPRLRTAANDCTQMSTTAHICAQVATTDNDCAQMSTTAHSCVISTVQDSTDQVSTVQDRSVQDRSGQVSSGQDRSRQVSTAQDSAAQRCANARDARFARVWEAYPSQRRINRCEAEGIFEAMGIDDETLETMLSALAVEKRSRGWSEEHGRFIPSISKWLADRRWESVDIPRRYAPGENPFEDWDRQREV